VQLTRNGIEHRHQFKFGAFRSEAAALALARARRDQLRAEKAAGTNGGPGAVASRRRAGAAFFSKEDIEAVRRVRRPIE